MKLINFLLKTRNFQIIFGIFAILEWFLVYVDSKLLKIRELLSMDNLND